MWKRKSAGIFRQGKYFRKMSFVAKRRHSVSDTHLTVLHLSLFFLPSLSPLFFPPSLSLLSLLHLSTHKVFLEVCVCVACMRGKAFWQDPIFIQLEIEWVLAANQSAKYVPEKHIIADTETRSHLLPPCLYIPPFSFIFRSDKWTVCDSHTCPSILSSPLR